MRSSAIATDPETGTGEASDLTGAQEPKDRPDFDQVYRAWFHHVSRWVRAFGGMEADLDDLTQEVFLVVQRKLDDFDGNNLAGWLYRIAQRTVSQYRRRAWVRRFFQPPPQQLEQLVDDADDPGQVAEKRDAERMIRKVLSRLSATRRTTFILFEIEGYTGEEIAALEGIPVNTVYTRLHHARKDFVKWVNASQGTA